MGAAVRTLLGHDGGHEGSCWYKRSLLSPRGLTEMEPDDWLRPWLGVDNLKE